MWKAAVNVTYKDGILEPQGATVLEALMSLGIDGVERVRIGKLIEIELPDSLSEEKAKDMVSAMCQKLLANPVMENYTFTVRKN